MADGLSINIVNLAEVRKYLEDFPEDTFDDAKVVFQKATLDAQVDVESNFGITLQSRTGALKRSIRTSASGKDLDSLQASIFGAAVSKGKPMVYTLMQEYGGEVIAKNAYKNVPGGPYLNIPTKSNKTPSGAQRMGAREVFRQGGYIVKGKKRWAVMLGGKAMFILVKRVKIPASLGMRDAAEDQVPVILARLIRLIGEG